MVQSELHLVREFGSFRTTSEALSALNSIFLNPLVLQWTLDAMSFDLPKTRIIRWQIFKDVVKTVNPKGEMVNAGIIEDRYYLFVELLLFRRSSDETEERPIVL